MKTMFTGNVNKSVPKKFSDCIKPDNVSTNLWVWGERLEEWGKVLFIFLIIMGVVLSLTSSISSDEVERSYYSTYETQFDFIIFITILIEYAVYAFIEYCAYHVLALLICSLASIVQNTRITADLAIYNSKDYSPENDDNSSSSCDEPKDESTSSSCNESENDSTSVPYWCAECGKAGPFVTVGCPDCGSGLRKFND